MKPQRWTFIVSAALVLFAQLSGQAQTSASTGLDPVLHALLGVHRFEQTSLAPDGRRVAWVETLVGKNGAPDGTSAVYVAPAGGSSAPRRVTAASRGIARAEGDVAWSPDAKQIAFLSDAAQRGQPQLYVIAAGGGVARILTNVKGFLASPKWAPDGKTIAVLFTENATRAAGPLVAETPQTGEIKEAVTEQRLALINVASPKLRQISPADMYMYEYDWSPDGRRFVVTAAHGNGDNNWYTAELFTLESDGTNMKSIYKPPLQIANPVWSPDGRAIAFIAGLMSDEPAVGGDIFTVDAAGGRGT